jgi:hypothetical protein
MNVKQCAEFISILVFDDVNVKINADHLTQCLRGDKENHQIDCLPGRWECIVMVNSLSGDTSDELKELRHKFPRTLQLITNCYTRSCRNS